MAADPYYKICCYPEEHPCRGKIDWHHNLIHAGRQSNIRETILPICEFIHAAARITHIKEKLDLVMLNRMSDEQVRSISKAVNYTRLKENLNKKYR